MSTLIDRLSPAAIGTASDDVEADIARAEQVLSLAFPAELREIMSVYRASIMFERGANFTPAEKSGWEDENGLLDLNILYGPSDDDTDIVTRNKWLTGNLPDNVVAIAESSGGNQICLERSTNRVLFWDHEAIDNGLFRVASDFSDFCKGLVEDVPRERGGDSGIIEDESYLDF